MRFSYFYVLLSLLLYLFGCSGGIKTRISKPVVSNIADWPQQFEANFSKISTLEGNARLTIETPAFSGHISLKTYWISPDTFFIQAEGPLGLDVGKMFIGETRFIIYNQFENQYLSGSIDDEFLGKFLQTDIYLKDLRQAILGRPLTHYPSLTLTDANHGIFRKRIGSVDYRYVVNPATGLLERWEKLQNDQIQVLQEFKNYHQLDQVYLPYLVQITLPREQQRISVFYKEIILNNPIDSKTYTIEIGPKVKQLNLN
jgi:hypothetical protein